MKQRAQAPRCSDVAVTEPDRDHSRDEFSERGKEVWRKDASLDGGANSDKAREPECVRGTLEPHAAPQSDAGRPFSRRRRLNARGVVMCLFAQPFAFNVMLAGAEPAYLAAIPQQAQFALQAKRTAATIYACRRRVPGCTRRRRNTPVRCNRRSSSLNISGFKSTGARIR
ncbi:hypothetical protein PSAC2689_110228 [Paraburkholderia sacchari]